METKVIISVFLNRKSNLKFSHLEMGEIAYRRMVYWTPHAPEEGGADLCCGCSSLLSDAVPSPPTSWASSSRVIIPITTSPGGRCFRPDPHRFCLSRGLVTTPPISSGSFPAPLKPPSAVLPSLTHVWLLAPPWTAARRAPLSSPGSRSLPKFISIESAMLSNHLIFCRPLHMTTEPSLWNQRRPDEDETQTTSWGLPSPFLTSPYAASSCSPSSALDGWLYLELQHHFRLTVLEFTGCHGESSKLHAFLSLFKCPLPRVFLRLKSPTPPPLLSISWCIFKK